MNNPVKAVLIEATFGTRETLYKHCPEYFRLQTGVWQIAIKSVSIYHTLTEDHIYNITSDLVNGHKFQGGKLKQIEVVLGQFKINKDISKEVIVNPNPTWFIINNYSSDNVFFYLDEWPKRPVPKTNNSALVGITVLFQRLR